jgi:Tfp pilus assembly protein PilX
MSKKNEKGAALILAMILVILLSVMAVSLLFMAQTETWSGMNYRTMTQARYGAESGVNAAANYIMNTPAVKPSAAAMGTFNYKGVSPVTVGVGGPVANLSASGSGNYPVTGAQSGFYAATHNSVTAGYATVSYSPTAQLLAMQDFPSVPYLTSNNVVQTWQITSDGTITGARNADVQVSAVLEQQPMPAFAYAAFAESTQCNALKFGGGGSTNSYDSSNLAAGFQNYGGNVGTNGNLSEKGTSTTIYGTLSTPRTGVGSCSAGNVTALDPTGGATVNCGSGNTNANCLVELPQNILYPTPNAPNPAPPTGNFTVANNNPSCGALSNCTALPANNPSDLYITAGTESSGSNPAANATLLPDVTVKGNLHFVPPTGTAAGASVYININTLSTNGNPNIYIDPIPGTNPPQYANLILNVAGAGVSSATAVVSMTGGTLINPSLNPATFQIVYGGTNPIVLRGGSESAGLVYAPNSTSSFSGGTDWYGAVITGTLTDMGGAAIHYDRRLQKELMVPGPFVLSSFTWKKY